MSAPSQAEPGESFDILSGTSIDRRDDGFFNASQMCTMGKKTWSHYFRNKGTRDILSILSTQLGVEEKHLVCSSNGVCTYAHPKLLMHLAQWLSPKFCLAASDWIVEWARIDESNAAKVKEELQTLEPSQSDMLQSRKRKALADLCSGKMEVPTKYGRIDIVEEDQITEVCRFDNWKSGLGSILVKSFTPEGEDKLMLLHLIIESKESPSIQEKLKSIGDVIDKFGVELQYSYSSMPLSTRLQMVDVFHGQDVQIIEEAIRELDACNSRTSQS